MSTPQSKCCFLNTRTYTHIETYITPLSHHLECRFQFDKNQPKHYSALRVAHKWCKSYSIYAYMNRKICIFSTSFIKIVPRISARAKNYYTGSIDLLQNSRTRVTSLLFDKRWVSWKFVTNNIYIRIGKIRVVSRNAQTCDEHTA